MVGHVLGQTLSVTDIATDECVARIILNVPEIGRFPA